MPYGKPNGKDIRLRMAQEAMQITANHCYPVHGEIISLPEGDYAKASYLGEAAMAFIHEQMETRIYEMQEFQTQYLVTKEDALDAAAGRDDKGPTLVMNFANARVPGAGFLWGSPGPEESMCRNSTLYASLGSPSGVLLYLHNNIAQLPVDSDCMTLSPDVVVFRAGGGHLLQTPFTTSVISVPAPDRRERAMDVPQDVLDTVMKQRLEKMILAAAYYGYRTLVLGAWGCRTYLHEASRVAGYFHEILIEREYGALFPRIVFAIFDRHSNEKLEAFQHVFRDVLDEDSRGYDKTPQEHPALHEEDGHDDLSPEQYMDMLEDGKEH